MHLTAKSFFNFFSDKIFAIESVDLPDVELKTILNVPLENVTVYLPYSFALSCPLSLVSMTKYRTCWMKIAA